MKPAFPRVLSLVSLAALGGCDGGTTGADAGRAVDAFSSTDAFSSSDAFCMRPTGIDLTGLGADCSGGAMCGAGYECLSISGAVLQQVCGISCEPADGGECACPAELVCGERTDKAGTHHECVTPDV